MNTIKFPLKPNMRRNGVANLQDGLLVLIEGGHALFAQALPLTHISEAMNWPQLIESLQQDGLKLLINIDIQKRRL